MDRLNVPHDGILLSTPHREHMYREVLLHAPEEACGIVAGTAGRSRMVFPIENVLHSPHRFRMHPQQQLRVFYRLEDAGWDLLGIYHSHPQGPATPSRTDLAEAAYPEAIHLIWSPTGGEWGCRAFLIDAQGWREVPIRVI